MVPYEARNTLRMSRIQSSQSDRHLSSNHESSQPQSSPLTPLTSRSVQSQQLTTNCDQTVPNCTTVSTQTAETAFAMCVRCSSTLKTLTSTAGQLQELCHCVHVPSQLSDTDWAREAETGSLDPEKWAEGVESDLETIRTNFQTKDKELAGLRDSLADQRSREEELESKLSQMLLEVNELRERAAERERNHVKELASCREAGSAQLREAERAWRSVQEHRDRLENQLAFVKLERDKLLASSADIGQ